MIKPIVSFEFFPAKTPEMEETLWHAIKAVEPLNPVYVSITYGAGGSTREKTRNTVIRVLKETSLKPASHLTCVGATRVEIDQIVKNYWDEGLKHIVALRGDAPKGTEKYVPIEGGYAYADDLVKGIKNIGDFEISVAAYPETHPEAISSKDDLAHLKRKLDAGATRAITQYFFDTHLYFDFLEKTEKLGIKKPIIPGVIFISGYKQIVRFSNMCGSNVPQWVHDKLAPVEDRPEELKKVSIEIATKICDELLDGGVKQFHFYTLNQKDVTLEVCKTFGVK